VLDRHAQPASEASGNPGGLFHGTAHATDGVHARFTRAAALLAARRHAAWIGSGRVAGRCDGLVRLRPSGAKPDLPTSYVQALDSATLAAQTGLALDEPAWLYPAGGWVSPAALAACCLDHPGITWHGDCTVDRVERLDGEWQALDTQGALIARAPVLVLAQGVQTPVGGTGADPWPLAPVRGQVTWFASTGGPHKPIAGHGYALSLPDGRLLCGATTAEVDGDPTVRASDHAINLERLHALTGLRAPPDAAPAGRVGWRATTPDRLPIVGAVPLPRAELVSGARLDHARLVPRIPGLFVLGGLASRGLTWAPLAAEVLAAWIDGAPMPLEADLLDAIDPARWLVRAARRSGR
jgi:tRNA 5-methylaminomethyl-2-thiouridine biosynthesis bifunctional protein